MPVRQPFTALCQAAARNRVHGRADLHVHTTCSDGQYTPPQVVELARRCGLGAVAITDHDTVAGVAPAQEAAAGSSIEVVAGVEISGERDGKECHILGHFVQVSDPSLRAALERLRVGRAGRFQEMIERLEACGVALERGAGAPPAVADALGRRHLAEMLVRAGQAGSVREAFTRYLRDGGRVAVPKLRLPVAEAISVIRGAGGVAAWAHPSYDCTRETLLPLRDAGLAAVEAACPGHRPSLERKLRILAQALGMAVTGGSDCHGPEPAGRTLGMRTVTPQELDELRRLAGR
jgi:predicted metal-dependent phosphoesterase TrpH